MKRIWLAVVGLLLLAGCGSGSGGESVVQASEQQQAYGAISVTIEHDNVSRSVLGTPAAGVAAAGRPAATHVRVVISNPSVTVGSIAFKDIADTAIPGTLTFSVPVATGYTVEALTYITDGTVKRVLEYGKSSLVTASGNATVAVPVTLVPVTVTLGMPASVLTRTSYTVTATLPADTPLANTWALLVNTTGFTAPLALSSFTTVHTLVAPSVSHTGTLYAQSRFILKRSLLNATEAQASWVYTYPNPAWGDPPVTAELLVPAGNITITFP